MPRDETNDAALLKRVQAILTPHQAIALGLGPDAVGVMGDTRVYGPVVFVRFPPGWTHEQIAELATEVINTVPEVTRVMMDITPDPS